MSRASLLLLGLVAWALPRPASAEPSESGPALLSASGLALEPEPGSLLMRVAAPDSAAQALGLEQNDRLLYLNGRRMEDLSDAAQGLASWTPGVRLWAVAERAGEVRLFSTPFPSAAEQQARRLTTLTASERHAQRGALAQAEQSVPQRVKTLRAAAFRVAPGEKAWIRFPKGIPIELAAGDVIEGLTSTSMATDSKLDFIAIPMGSPVWAQALTVKQSKGIRLIKLHLYKIRLKDGHIYPCSAVITDVSGDQSLLKASPGGTVVVSEPEQGLYAVEPTRNFQASFLKPLTIYELPGFYAAGPGLWLRTVQDGSDHSFKITHVIPQRSADIAGLKVGDRVEAIAGTPARKLAFSEAIERLYGSPGSSVKLRVARADKGTLEDVTLTRGVEYRRESDKEIPTRLRVESRLSRDAP